MVRCTDATKDFCPFLESLSDVFLHLGCGVAGETIRLAFHDISNMENDIRFTLPECLCPFFKNIVWSIVGRACLIADDANNEWFCVSVCYSDYRAYANKSRLLGSYLLLK